MSIYKAYMYAYREEEREDLQFARGFYGYGNRGGTLQGVSTETEAEKELDELPDCWV